MELADRWKYGSRYAVSVQADSKDGTASIWLAESAMPPLVFALLSGAAALAPISVYDNVFSSADLHALDNEGTTGHRCYARGQEATLLETALDSVLAELGDDAPFVEYWARDVWKHLEAHADVDEALAKETGELRWPRHGHVLYLDVGCEVRGPTCVFAEDALVSVPAVAGRVLRFDGHLVHAVPEPFDVWFRSFSKRSPASKERRRSVVLFNTWTEPPLGVPLNDAADADGAPAMAQPREAWTEATIREVIDADDRVAGKLPRLGDPTRRCGLPRFRSFEAPAGLLDALREERSVCHTRLREPG